VADRRQLCDPLTYDHRYSSMAELATRLALLSGAPRTQHAYYRAIRLLGDHFACDPASLSQNQFRDYILHVKTVKHWMPRTIRQTLAVAKLFFVDMLRHTDWTVFSQIKTKDPDSLPHVLTREQVRALIEAIRLRRYRIPIKLIYCCGLRLSECLSLTVDDIDGKERKLWVRAGKGNKDRMVPLPEPMLQDLRAYWKMHKNPRLIFPNAGRGQQHGPELFRRMHEASDPMPVCSLQRLLVVARKQLRIPDATIHTLRHSFATHMLEAGASVHTVQRLLGHSHIETTMGYLHLTHQSETGALQIMEGLCYGLPR
jgi:integrase